MFERGMNKKAQEGVTLGTLLLIVLGAVVVVVIILGATGIFGNIFGAGGQLTSKELEVVVQNCKLAAENDLIADYCLEFKKVRDDEYISCVDGRVIAILSQQSVETLNCGSLAANTITEAKRDICEDISVSKRNKVKVDGEKCSDVMATAPGVTPVSITLTKDSPQTINLGSIRYTLKLVEVTNNDNVKIKIWAGNEPVSAIDNLQSIKKNDNRGTQFLSNTVTIKVISITLPDRANVEVSVALPSCSPTSTDATTGPVVTIAPCLCGTEKICQTTNEICNPTDKGQCTTKTS